MVRSSIAFGRSAQLSGKQPDRSLSWTPVGSYGQSCFVPLTDASVGFGWPLTSPSKRRALARVEEAPRLTRSSTGATQRVPARYNAPVVSQWYNALTMSTTAKRVSSERRASKRKGQPKPLPRRLSPNSTALTRQTRVAKSTSLWCGRRGSNPHSLAAEGF